MEHQIIGDNFQQQFFSLRVYLSAFCPFGKRCLFQVPESKDKITWEENCHYWHGGGMITWKTEWPINVQKCSDAITVGWWNAATTLLESNASTRNGNFIALVMFGRTRIERNWFFTGFIWMLYETSECGTDIFFNGFRWVHNLLIYCAVYTRRVEGNYIKIWKKMTVRRKSDYGVLFCCFVCCSW